MKKIQRKQFAKADSLIRNICANYDSSTEFCLPLDTKCPQMLTDRIVCKYFRDVLLEDKEGADLKAMLIGGNIRYCESCRRPYSPPSNRSKYCPECVSKVRRQQTRERVRNLRGITT